MKYRAIIGRRVISERKGGALISAWAKVEKTQKRYVTIYLLWYGDLGIYLQGWNGLSRGGLWAWSLWW